MVGRAREMPTVAVSSSERENDRRVRAPYATVRCFIPPFSSSPRATASRLGTGRLSSQFGPGGLDLLTLSYLKGSRKVQADKVKYEVILL